MPNFNPYANYGYAALIKEVTAGTPIKPTNYLRFISESLNAMYGHQDINEIAGDRERRIRHIQSQNEVDCYCILALDHAPSPYIFNEGSVGNHL